MTPGSRNTNAECGTCRVELKECPFLHPLHHRGLAIALHHLSSKSSQTTTTRKMMIVRAVTKSWCPKLSLGRSRGLKTLTTAVDDPPTQMKDMRARTVWADYPNCDTARNRTPTSVIPMTPVMDHMTRTTLADLIVALMWPELSRTPTPRHRNGTPTKSQSQLRPTVIL